MMMVHDDASSVIKALSDQGCAAVSISWTMFAFGSRVRQHWCDNEDVAGTVDKDEAFSTS